MITYFDGTVFNTPAKTIVNTVNCVGVMGKGLALEFKLRYPKMFEEYKKHCKTEEMKIGKIKLYKNSEDLWIMNFPTKDHWRSPSKIEYIEAGLKYFVSNYKKVNIESIAFPKLGTNNGGLKWKDVNALMEKYLSKLDIDVYICLDKKKEPEGKEKEMIEKVVESDIEDLINNVGLKSNQAKLIKRKMPMSRFWYIQRISGIGKRTYEKIFNYYYISTNNNEITKKVISTDKQLTFL